MLGHFVKGEFSGFAASCGHLGLSRCYLLAVDNTWKVSIAMAQNAEFGLFTQATFPPLTCKAYRLPYWVGKAWKSESFRFTLSLRSNKQGAPGARLLVSRVGQNFNQKTSTKTGAVARQNDSTEQKWVLLSAAVSLAQVANRSVKALWHMTQTSERVDSRVGALHKEPCSLRCLLKLNLLYLVESFLCFSRKNASVAGRWQVRLEGKEEGHWHWKSEEQWAKF